MPDSQAALRVRELYCPAHFGNTYECVRSGEMTDLLAEAKFWGYNRYSDWFDAVDLRNVYVEGKTFGLAQAVWDRKFDNFRCAAEVGFPLGLVMCPNHVFLDQVTPDNAAAPADWTSGQVVCPSKLGVADMVLENYRRLFEDFRRRGLKLDALSACPYDFGGCACEACAPWIVTFGKLFLRIADLAKETFGDVEVGLIGWWWTDEDHPTFTEWAQREAPGRFESMAHWMRYHTTEYDPRPVPQGCAERAFVHIGYGERNEGDCYGHYGPIMAPDRLEATCRYLFERGADGLVAYSEGACDDINKAIVGGLASGQFSSADNALKTYAERYLGGDARGWCEWMHLMGFFHTIDVSAARKLFDSLAPAARGSWRLAQLRERLLMAEADCAVRAHAEWSAERLAAAEAFLACRERLYRDVWRLGLTTYILRLQNCMPDWYEGYLAHLGHPPAATTTNQ